MTTIKNIPEPIRIDIGIQKLTEAGFGRIADRIRDDWDVPQYVKPYFSELLLANRDDRQGFPKDVFSIILKLYIAHEHQYPTKITADYWLTKIK